MINPEELRRLPTSEGLMEMATDQEIRSNLRTKIEHIIRHGVHQKQYQTSVLFSMGGDDEFSMNFDLDHNFLGTAEPGNFQVITFEIMKQYGLSLEVISANRVFDRQEYTDYPSQTIPGLFFQRERQFLPDAFDATNKVIWRVESDGNFPSPPPPFPIT